MPSEKKRPRSFYTATLQRHGIVGSSLMFLHDNQVLATEHYGLANLERQQRVDANTIYHWASITKTFTGIATMQLRDRGRLRLEDPVVKYLPELRAVHDPRGDIGEITLWHLMTHSSGFRSSTWPWGGKDWQPHEPRCWSQLVAMMPYTEILFPPGSKYSQCSWKLCNSLPAVSGQNALSASGMTPITPIGKSSTRISRLYEAEKQRIANETIAALNKRWPGLAAQVGVVDVPTPATYYRHTGNRQSSPDGWYITPKNTRSKAILTLPDLQNLYMAGQLAGFVPPPRFNVARHHGILAPVSPVTN